MTMNKKAQGLSLNTVVIAAIVLIVLVVLIGIFTGSLGRFVEGFLGTSQNSCPIEDQKTECNSFTEKPIFGPFEPKLAEGKKCCQPKETISCEGNCMLARECHALEDREQSRDDRMNTMCKSRININFICCLREQ